MSVVGIAAAPAHAASAPKLPVISEPGPDNQLVSGADVHMETAPFKDADGDGHLCTDWEIWTVKPHQRVWFSSCISGVQRVHAHLGDGVFENSLAGRADLLPDTDYELRVRFRDDSGDPATEWSPYATRPFRTDTERAPLPGASQWDVKQPGYVVEEVASGFQLPVNIAMVPNQSSDPAKPMFYVTELYGKIKVVTGNFKVSNYAQDLLNFKPSGDFPGTGEIGLTGITVDPASGDVFAGVLYKSGDRHYPKVVRFHSTDGGFTSSSQKTILDMHGAPQEASHQISNLTIGPDGKLYVHMGEGFSPSVANDLNSFRGKVLRMNLDGSAPSDNPYYKASDGIKAKDYVFASGFRNPFGGAWRAADGQHYEVENGPQANDRFAKVTKGTEYGWDASPESMKKHALYNWNPTHAPVNIAFINPDEYHASGFPDSTYDDAFVSESGPTYASGPQDRGKRIVQFDFNDNGSVSSPKTLVEYNGSGKSTVAGLAAGTGGLYFTALYPDSRSDRPTEAKAKIYRIRFTRPTTAKAPLMAYQNRDFHGHSQSFDAGIFEASTHELGNVGNDSISSLRVAGGYRAVVCEHGNTATKTNAGDLGLCRYYGPGDHNSVGRDLNDKISSIAVFAGPSAGNAAIVYQGFNLGGGSQPMGTGIYEAAAGELKPTGATMISSLKVEAGHQVIVCQHDRSSGVDTANLGLCRYFAPGSHATVGADLDNQISLVAVGGAN